MLNQEGFIKGVQQVRAGQAVLPPPSPLLLWHTPPEMYWICIRGEGGRRDAQSWRVIRGRGKIIVVRRGRVLALEAAVPALFWNKTRYQKDN